VKLYDLMQDKGYSIRTLAKEAGVGITTINYILNGRDGVTYYAGATIRRKICAVLAVEANTIDEFHIAIEYYKGKGQPVKNEVSTGNLTSAEIAALSLAS
jgi:transcriptional regulator with XRE-family HTH domain